MTVLNDFSLPAPTTTTDIVTTTVLTYPIPNNTGGVFVAKVTGRNTSTNATANAILQFGAQNVAGTAAVVGTPQATLSVANGSDASMNTVVVAVSASAGNILVRVTGLALTTIQWAAKVEALVG